jgi:alkanesulfonate monooxygenase SsuD/methylene tetrahydromethanopterin reductase-like flavin-dependent oxidoreductase (luciferase family)
MPMATATDTPAMIELAGARGYTLLSAQLEPAASLRKRANIYLRAGKAAGHAKPLQNIAAARYVYLADSRGAAMDDLRDDINYELGYQMKRGLIRVITSSYGLKLKGDTVTFDELAETGIYCLGDPDTVVKQLRQFYDESGGFGTLLIVAGKKWATPEKVARSMRLFMEHVAPKLRDLVPVRDPDSVAA